MVETAHAPLLAEDELPAAEVLNPDATGDLVLVCEHASAAIPAALGTMGLPERALAGHWAWDIGALDVAKAMALGADAVAIGSAALIALGDNDPKWEAEYNALGTTAGAYDDWHEGRDPAGITTQDPALMARFAPIEGGRRLRNYLKVMTLEAQTIARACGKSHLHNLEPEDLCAVTLEAAAMAKIPLAGTDWYPGKPGTTY